VSEKSLNVEYVIGLMVFHCCFPMPESMESDSLESWILKLERCFLPLIPEARAGRNAPSENFFGGHIFNLVLRFRVKIQVCEGFQSLILAGCFRRAETFLPGQSDDKRAAFCGYIHVQVLFQEGLNCFVESAGNVQRHALIRVYLFVSEIPCPRNPALNSNHSA